jgi:ABC-type molybdate transport system substrate-binding protein
MYCMAIVSSISAATRIDDGSACDVAIAAELSMLIIVLLGNVHDSTGDVNYRPGDIHYC